MSAKRRPLARVALVSVTALLSAAVVAGSAVAGTTSGTISFSYTAFNSCVGEAVAVTGKLHITLSQTTSKSGNEHGTMITSFQGSGVGLTTGSLYSSLDRSTDEFTYSRATYEFTKGKQYLFVSRGGTQNFLLHVTIHVTVTHQGILAAYVDNIYFSCRG